MTEQSPKTSPEKSRDGLWVLSALIAFFVIFASVDAFFVYKAITTHSGVVTENAYEKGLRFNELLDQAAAQKDAQKDAQQKAVTTHE